MNFKDENNVLRFVRPNRWLSLDLAGKPVRCGRYFFLRSVRGRALDRARAWMRVFARERAGEGFVRIKDCVDSRLAT